MVSFLLPIEAKNFCVFKKIKASEFRAVIKRLYLKGLTPKEMKAELLEAHSSYPRKWELAVPTIDASSSLRLPHSTNLWHWSEEEAMSWEHPWRGPPAPTF